MSKILVTGGCGYIGSHTVLELLNKGYEVVVVDNFSNSSFESLKRVQNITGKMVIFYEADIRDCETMNKIFEDHTIDAVIHFAAFKAVGESCRLPLKYYENNISGTIGLLQIMEKHGVKKIIFSSSATVYGDPERLPLDEDCRLSTTNPYGSTKLMMEMIMQDLDKADNEWNVILLRYFNPVGAHESGLIGEDPKGIPNNLMPFVAQVASGKLACINVFGNDYDTPDGTGVRDYIHVVDLAKGHVAAVKYAAENLGCDVFNLGTGTALTESNNTDNTKRVVAKIGDTYYATLADAIAAAQDGNTITIITDITLDEGVVVPAGKNITLDLNGKTVSHTISEKLTKLKKSQKKKS